MKFGFYSCMAGMPWGGSEVLWYRSARQLLNLGNDIAVNYKWWPNTSPALLDLEKMGAELWLRNKPPATGTQNMLLRFRDLLSGGKTEEKRNSGKKWVESVRPDAAMITLGYHPDQIPVADALHERGIPYGINVQCASNFFFIPGDAIENYRRWYTNAEKVLFVSGENQHKIENNIAMKLTNAEIVANPFNVEHSAAPEWPESREVFKLACVGRIHFQSKGQDIIVDVMKQDKWRNRPIEVSFYGHDQGNKKQLEELIKMHGLENRLRFAGFVDKVEDIWSENHALLLPSRYEGAPLVVIEAMLCNRIAICTDIGRNRELMDDGESGFVSEGTTISLLDAAMERAWEKRDQWQQMGQLAGEHIRQRYPVDPIREFAEQILSLKPGGKGFPPQGSKKGSGKRANAKPESGVGS